MCYCSDPALFRQAFEILCRYPAQEISYTKLLGQLQDKGNTDLVKYYIELYGGAFLLHAIHKYTNKAWLSRSSSPKMLPACPALYRVAVRGQTDDSPEQMGRLFELAVGAELIQQPVELHYWRERQSEVDFVVTDKNKTYAIEVKSGRKKTRKGLDEFRNHFPDAACVVITPDNFEEFSVNPRKFLETIAI